MSTHIVNGVSISGSALDVLYKLFFYGSLDDGDLPSKAGMSELIGLGWAHKKYQKPAPNRLSVIGHKVARDHYRCERSDMQSEIVQLKQSLSANISALNLKDGDLVIYRACNKQSFEEKKLICDEIRKASGVQRLTFVALAMGEELHSATDEALSSLGLMRKPVSLDAYDAGHLNDHGGGNVGWWQDYIRSELERAHDHYQSQLDGGGPS